MTSIIYIAFRFHANFYHSYRGDTPEAICSDAEAFAYPYLVLNEDQVIAPPAHRRWNASGVGEIPLSSSAV